MDVKQAGARAATYARISQDRVGAGLGVARQREDCERLIRERGLVPVGEYSDNDVSAYSGKPRPGYRQLLADMQAGRFDVVVAWHADRLHRSPVELEHWIDCCERAGVTTLTVRAGELDLTTAAGRMVARMLGAAARHESELKSERIRRVRAQEAKAGKAHGSLGYGYRRDPASGQWQVVEEQAAIIREIAERLLNGGESPSSIAGDLNRRGVPTPRNSPSGWQHGNTSRMVCAARLCGFREWTPAPTRGGRGRGRGMGPLVARGDWPAILTVEQTRQLRTLFAESADRRRSAPGYLLSGLLRCGMCRAPLVGLRDQVHAVRMYRCRARRGNGNCAKTRIAADAAERHVAQLLSVALRGTRPRSGGGVTTPQANGRTAGPWEALPTALRRELIRTCIDDITVLPAADAATQPTHERFCPPRWRA
jgi:DNA invertase Pin-like site-specific DNA recombinase